MQSRLRAKYRRRTRTVTCSVKNAYLREDVPCGVADGACRHCPPLSGGSLLDPQAQAYLVPDAATLDALLEVWILSFMFTPSPMLWVVVVHVPGVSLGSQVCPRHCNFHHNSSGLAYVHTPLGVDGHRLHCGVTFMRFMWYMLYTGT